MTKKCSRCKEVKSISQFGWKKKDKTRQAFCKPCQRENSRKYYYNNHLDQKTKSIVRRRDCHERNARKMYEYFKANPCIDCGEDNPVKLESDHQGDKKYTISKLINSTSSWEHIEKELTKCETRCANCHRVKTAKDFNHKMYELWLEEQAALVLTAACQTSNLKVPGQNRYAAPNTITRDSE